MPQTDCKHSGDILLYLYMDFLIDRSETEKKKNIIFFYFLTNSIRSRDEAKIRYRLC